jgi:VWFA-related protein
MEQFLICVICRWFSKLASVLAQNPTGTDRLASKPLNFSNTYFMSIRRIILPKLSLLVFCLAAPTFVLAQQKPGATPTPTPDEDVLRISTELVQTDVVVLDKQGRFVDGLKPEQFSLKVDGQVQPIAFFERITAGAANEERQLNVGRTAGAANDVKPVIAATAGASDATILGRTILFFIDDMHLAADSMDRVRKVLLRFIDREMAADDIVAISSPTGNIGFLQQFTNNKTVLRAAVARLAFQPFIVSDRQLPTMNEYQALAIDRGETQVLEPFIEQMLHENPRMLRSVAEATTRQRATQILNQASVFTMNMLGSLESLMQSSTRLPGRKLAFFFSDGFYIDRRKSGAQARMNTVTNMAARAGVVIYTLDARGLVTLLVDPTQEELFDPYGRHASVVATAAPITAAQDVLVTLAENTGGRVFINSNKLDTGVNAALAEISNYYLLAWRPNPESNRGGKFHRLEVSVIGRSDLKVRARQGYLTEAAVAKEKETAKPPAVPLTPSDELRNAINSLTSRKGLKTSLAINYVDLPEKTVLLTIAVKIRGEDLSYTPVGDKFSSTVDILGAVYDAKGQPVSTFQDKLNVTADSQQPENLRKVKAGFTAQAAVTPGLYQVRVAARDAQSKMVGSATEWIDVPDLTKGQLNMSGLYVSEMTQGSTPTSDAEAFKLSNLNIDRRFAKSSRLLFLTYLYNASRGATGTAAPDVAVQIEVMSETKTLIKTDWRKVTTEDLTDLTRIPYSAEIPLRGLAPGRYTLRVTINDRVAKTTAVQSVRFVVSE